MKLFLLVAGPDRMPVGIYSTDALAKQQASDIGETEYDIEEHDLDHQHRWSWKRVGGSPDMLESYEKVCLCSVCLMERP